MRVLLAVGYWRKVGKSSKSSKSSTKKQKSCTELLEARGVGRCAPHGHPRVRQRCSGTGRVQLEHRLAVGGCLMAVGNGEK